MVTFISYFIAIYILSVYILSTAEYVEDISVSINDREYKIKKWLIFIPIINQIIAALTIIYILSLLNCD